MAWILRAFKAIVLVLVADAVPGGPLRLEHAKVPSFLNSSALSKAWLSDALRRRALFGKVPEAQETISRSHLELEQLGGSLPSSGSAIVLYAAHDASITISMDGRIQCVLELERLFKIRYYWPPLEASETVWFEALMVVKARCPEACPESFDYGAIVLFESPKMEPRVEYSALPLIVEKVFPVKQWRLVDHHEAHARMSFFDSPFQQALILSYDGGGNDGVFNVYYGQEKTVLRLGQLGIDLGERYATIGAMMTEISSREVDASCSNYVAKPASLNLPPDALVDLVYGYNFSMIDHLSWTGKLMAYASLGVPSPDIEALMSKYLRNHAQGGELMPVGLVRACCESLNGQRAVAAAAQAQFETYMLELVKDLLKELSPLGLPRPEGLVLTGGCALNVLANQVIYDTLSENAKDPIGIYVPAAPNDSGLSVGGAWSLVQPAEKQQLQYAGFRLWDDSILEEMAVAWGARRLSEMGGVNFLAELLSTGPPGEKPIVAVVRGRQEFGPRALGHRSLLAVPDSALMRDRMNRLKGRQWFRPVAPMIADEALRQVFGREVKSPYMSMAPRVLEEVLKEFPALAHLDGTARHQSVGAKDEPWVHALLLAVGKHTGLAALINTSFNSKGRPIANTVKESLDMLRELSDLDYVLIEDWLFKAPGRQ